MHCLIINMNKKLEAKMRQKIEKKMIFFYLSWLDLHNLLIINKYKIG